MKRLRTEELPGGERVPVLGMGTWRMGADPDEKRTEITALRTGLELGMTLIDTAEMYADGGAERVVGEATRDRREEVFLVTKFYPRNATPDRMEEACDRSLKRLRTDRIDLYLLHWRGDVPLSQTLEGFDRLVKKGKIRYPGVSNFDASDMEELFRLKDGKRIVTDQVLYNLVRRGAEIELIPWCRKRKRPIMAYSPIEEGLLAGGTDIALRSVAERHDATPAQIALAWVVREEGVIAIPKSSSVAHVRENRKAAEIRLTKRDLDELDGSYSAPAGPVPLETR